VCKTVCLGEEEAAEAPTCSVAPNAVTCKIWAISLHDKAMWQKLLWASTMWRTSTAHVLLEDWAHLCIPTRWRLRYYGWQTFKQTDNTVTCCCQSMGSTKIVQLHHPLGMLLNLLSDIWIKLFLSLYRMIQGVLYLFKNSHNHHKPNLWSKSHSNRNTAVLPRAHQVQTKLASRDQCRCKLSWAFPLCLCTAFFSQYVV
jgi:hypothetical protein